MGTSTPIVNAIPDWAKTVGANMQAQADAKFADEKRSYAQASADWITNNVLNRDNGQPILPFPPVPQRVVFFWSEDDHWFRQKLEPDPSIQPPVLPPPTKKDPGAPLMTGAGAFDAQLIGMLTTILQDVIAIKAKVGA